MRGANVHERVDDYAGRVREETPDPGRDFVKSFERGLGVIRAVGETGTPLTVVEVGHRSNLTRAAARCFLLTLIRLSYVDTDGRYYWLRPRVLEL